MFRKSIDIMNILKALGRDKPNSKLVNKFLWSLSRNWEPKVITILEAKDLTMLKLEQLNRLLITHDMLNSTDEKKKDLAPKASSHDNNGHEVEKVALLLQV